jgi:hypothetical protein
VSEYIKRLRAVVPVLMPDLSYLRNPEQRELYLSGVLGDGRTRIATASMAETRRRCAEFPG